MCINIISFAAFLSIMITSIALVVLQFRKRTENEAIKVFARNMLSDLDQIESLMMDYRKVIGELRADEDVQKELAYKVLNFRFKESKMDIGKTKDEMLIRANKKNLIHNVPVDEDANFDVVLTSKDLDEYKKLEALTTMYLTRNANVDLNDYADENKDHFPEQNSLYIHVFGMLINSTKNIPSVSELILTYIPAFISFASIITWLVPIKNCS